MNLPIQALLKLSFRILLVWLLCSVLAFMLANSVMEAYLPWIRWLIDGFAPEYTPQLDIVLIKEKYMVQMQAITQQPIYISPTYSIPIGSKMKAATNVIHNLVPVVILFTIVLSAPADNWRHRCIMILMALLTISIIMSITTPSLLSGHIEILYQNLSRQYQVSREIPFLLNWMVFVETGGIWVLPIVGSVLSLYSARKLNRFISKKFSV